MVMHTGGVELRFEIPKLLVIRGVVHIYLLGIQYPPSTRNTSDIGSAPRLSHRLKLRPDVSLRSVNKIYSCMESIAYFASPPLLYIKYCFTFSLTLRRNFWKVVYLDNINAKRLTLITRTRRKRLQFDKDIVFFFLFNLTIDLMFNKTIVSYYVFVAFDKDIMHKLKVIKILQYTLERNRVRMIKRDDPLLRDRSTSVSVR